MIGDKKKMEELLREYHARTIDALTHFRKERYSEAGTAIFKLAYALKCDLQDLQRKKD